MTPMTLASTAALRGEPRRWTLVIRSHGRWPYLSRCVESIDEKVGLEHFDRLILSVDGPADGPLPATDREWDVVSTGPHRQGLTANVRQAWGTVADGMVFDCEEDFTVTDAPLDDMADLLDAHPDVCVMNLLRQPWSPDEQAAGSLLRGHIYQGTWTVRDGWLEQRRLWSLNPAVLRAGTCAAVLPGVETELTRQALERGWSFGMYGGIDDPPRVTHIGTDGGMGSEGWSP